MNDQYRCSTSVGFGIVLCLFLSVCLSAAAWAGNAGLYIVDEAGVLGRVDVGTGAATVIGNTGVILTDIAFDPNGRLFGLSLDRFYEIDPNTGGAKDLGAHGVPLANALVIDPNGTIYAAGYGSTWLYTLDPNSARATPFRDIGRLAWGDLALRNGMLYLTAWPNDLVRLDLAGTGPATLVGSFNLSNLYGMDALDGVLYGAAGTVLYTIDPNTVQPTRVCDYTGQGLGAAWGAAAQIPRFSGGTGEPNDPYRIATAQQLIAINSDPNLLKQHFTLVADIDLDPNLPGGEVFSEAVVAPNPLGHSLTRTGPVFTGTFNGEGHVIRNLTIDNHIGALGTGLFGWVGGNGRVQNLRLEAVNICGGNVVGAVAGRNYGTITDCHVTGCVRGYSHVGGLTGVNGPIPPGSSYATPAEFPSLETVHGLISACSVDAEVSGIMGLSRPGYPSVSTEIGGLAGTNYFGVIQACRCTGTVTSGDDVGGLVGGNNYGWIRSSYAANRVEGYERVGGIVGTNYGDILFCYAVGPLHGGVDTEAGGIAGSSGEPAYLCYWNMETTGTTWSMGGRARTTSQMKNRETFRGWGYDNQWVLVDGQDYPRLAWEGSPGEPLADDPAPFASGAGTAEDPYVIATARQMLAFGYGWPWFDRHFVLGADIDLAGTDPNDTASAGPPALPFSGSFDGQGHIVTHWRLWNPSEGQVGLFGYIGQTAALRNVTLSDADVRGTTNVGILASVNKGTLTNCAVDGYAYGSSWAGGLLGRNDGTVTACAAGGEVIGKDGAGGLVYHNSGTMGGSRAGAVVTSTAGYAGGFVVYNGFATISSSCSHGTVVGARGAGGFAFSNSGDEAALRDCYCRGTVESTEMAGGFAGWNSATIQRCYSACVVRSAGKMGGFTAVADERPYPEPRVVESCYWDMEVGGVQTSNAGTGRTTAALQSQATFSAGGWDFENVWTICEGKDYPRLKWEGIQCGR